MKTAPFHSACLIGTDSSITYQVSAFKNRFSRVFKYLFGFFLSFSCFHCDIGKRVLMLEKPFYN